MFARNLRFFTAGVSLSFLALLTIQCSDEKNEKEAAPSGSAAQEARDADSPASAAEDPEFAGEIFGVPVPVGNYYFAKRVHDTFHHPEEAGMNPEEKEKFVWHNLVLHFEAAKRKIEPTEVEMAQWIDSVFTALDLPIRPSENPEEYKKWVEETMKATPQLFENQMRYLATIEKIKREMVKEMQVEVSEEEMHEEYLNIENHVGGDYLIFETREEAAAFHGAHSTPEAWEKFKEENPDKIKPFHLITLQAIIDLWSVPKDQINEFHSLSVNTVGKPLPFGNQWGVFRLLEKKEGDISNFDEGKNEEYRLRVESKKKYQARDEWVEKIYHDAQVKVFIKPEVPAAETPENAPH